MGPIIELPRRLSILAPHHAFSPRPLIILPLHPHFPICLACRPAQAWEDLDTDGDNALTPPQLRHLSNILCLARARPGWLAGWLACSPCPANASGAPRRSLLRQPLRAHRVCRFGRCATLHALPQARGELHQLHQETLSRAPNAGAGAMSRAGRAKTSWPF